MLTLQKIACVGGFGRWKWDLKDVRGIYERARHSDSWLESQTMPLVGAKLSSQTLVVVGERMRFQALSN